MDRLIRQMRVIFSNVGQENSQAPSRDEDQRKPIQKTQSLKGEKKRAQNWLRRLFSRQRRGDLDSNYQQEHATAVAAAAYAINSLEESDTPHRKTISGPSQLGENATTISIIPDTELLVTATKDEKDPEKAIDTPPSIKKTTSFAIEISEIPDHTAKSKRTRSKVTDPGPSKTRAPTFADERLSKTSSRKPEAAVLEFDRPPTTNGRTASKSDIPPPIKPATQPTETKRQSSKRPGTDGTKADAWEKAEMAKIKERYEKLDETIVSWENRKKNKARRKLDKTEMDLEKRRAKALQKYRRNMESIHQIAGGARAQAVEKRKNEEFKAKAKANTIRTKGKLPATCFCF